MCFPGTTEVSEHHFIEPNQLTKASPIVVEPKNGKKLRNGGHKSKPHELDSHSLVPLPAKTCFTCEKSCKKAPLIACDFCPLFFHLDCLDPPLTALPTTMWMCPVHPHQIAVKLIHLNMSIH